MRIGENCVEFTLVKITYNSVEFTFSDTSNSLTNDKYGLYICEGDESSTCERSGLYTLDSAVSYSYDVGTISGLKPNTLYTLSADAYPVSGVDAYGYITFTTGSAPKLIDLNGLEYFKTKMDANIASLYLPLTGGSININASGTINLNGTTNATGAKLKWATVNSKNPYIGYATDQVDGTFVWSITGTNYASGLAIGGGSGNLLWKGAKVATVSDLNGATIRRWD